MVDVRRGSPTFGEREAFELTDENLHKLYCAIGFAYGFCVLTKQADVIYKQAPFYEDRPERGIAYDDPDVAIACPEDVVLVPSQRDANGPRLPDIESQLPYVYEGVVAAS